MNILSVGDIHGKKVWQEIDPTKYDRVIFIGDLFDAYEYTPDEIHTNALEIVQWAYMACNVQFVIGNHDAHYFKWQTPLFQDTRCSGYVDKQLYRAYQLYHENKELFKVSYQYGNYLWTHAGLSNASYKAHFEPLMDGIKTTQGLTKLCAVLNYLWDINNSRIIKVPKSRRGDDEYGSILWADISDTCDDPLEGYHQIVGHSAVKDIIHKQINNDTSITYIDCLNKKIGKFYEINI